jgi:oxalate decarboxylase/phosphoglucose isomerase-like protein (cupin superfamily)
MPAAAPTTPKPSSRSPAQPVLVRGADFVAHALHGTGAIRRAIYPELTGSRRLFVGLAEFGPGTAPHVFHRHGTEVVGPPGARRRLTYAEDFEEFYFVVEGSGEMQWRFDDGRERREPLAAGDAVYFPPGVVEHRVFNTGPGPMRVLYGGTPPARVDMLD